MANLILSFTATEPSPHTIQPLLASADMAIFEKRDPAAMLVRRATTTTKASATSKDTTSKTSTASSKTNLSSTLTATTITSASVLTTSSVTTQSTSTSSSQIPASATATAVGGSRSTGLSTGGVVAIIFGLIALILLVALIVVLLQRRANNRRGGDHAAEKDGFYPLQDPVGPPATYSWQPPVTPGVGGADGQSIHEASSIQNSVGYSNSPMIGPATMLAIPDGLRPGVQTDSRHLDLEIPGFETRSALPAWHTPSVRLDMEHPFMNSTRRPP
jgi:hypothetical protein